MEGIKRIEHLIERCNECKLNACITCDICWSEVQAIENLLTRYKEMKENIGKEHTLGYSQGVYDCSEAWKETIKEKIEEYEKQRIKMEKDDVGVGFTLGKEWSDLKAKIEVLQELLRRRGEIR